MKRKEATVLYCNTCRMTTPHSIAGNSLTCKRCGAVKSGDGAKQRRENASMMEFNADSGGHWN